MLDVQVTQSPHIEFHLKWAEGVLLNHGSHIMVERATFSASLRALHMGFSKQFGGMCKMPKLLLRCGLLHCVCVWGGGGESLSRSSGSMSPAPCLNKKVSFGLCVRCCQL